MMHQSAWELFTVIGVCACFSAILPGWFTQELVEAGRLTRGFPAN